MRKNAYAYTYAHTYTYAYSMTGPHKQYWVEEIMYKGSSVGFYFPMLKQVMLFEGEQRSLLKSWADVVCDVDLACLPEWIKGAYPAWDGSLRHMFICRFVSIYYNIKKRFQSDFTLHLRLVKATGHMSNNRNQSQSKLSDWRIRTHVPFPSSCSPGWWLRCGVFPSLFSSLL